MSFSSPELIALLLLLVIFLLVVLVVTVLRVGRANSEIRETIIRQEARLEEQARQAELRGRGFVESARVIEHAVRRDVAQMQQTMERQLGELSERLSVTLGQHQTRFEQRHSESIKSLQETLENGLRSVRMQVLDALTRSADELGKRFDGLTQSTDQRLKDISGQVEKRLTEGFEKTTATFADVLKRLALIDEAQKKITELSTNVVSLQEVLSDKRSRGAFGEVQLNALVRNVLPESSFALQYTLSNERVADCVLFLPEPTGSVVIDAKFPKESFDRMTDFNLGESDRKDAERQFKIDIRKHITDIGDKYILPGETSDGAVMFIPAEAIFAEIHAHHPDLVEAAHARRVWLVSPTTMMAILNTARAVLKDEATRKQVHVIQEHLGMLAKDFDRFQERMENLSRHIRQAHEDVDQVHISAGKITSRFLKIEKVELEGDQPPALEVDDD